MRSKIITVLTIGLSFTLGYLLNSILTSQPNKDISMKSEKETLKRVSGIGGIFFKCNDPAKVREWYSKHLGLETDQYGTTFEWRQGEDATKKGFTQWSPFSDKTKYFEPSTREFMINYRVENLESLLGELRKEGVNLLGGIESYEYGKFAHILDIEGNKIELWEPNDEEYDKIVEARTK